MKRIISISILALLTLSVSAKATKEEKMAFDFSTMRGFNYAPAGASPSYTDIWTIYKEETTCFNLDLAKKLNLNQARIFIFYEEYQKSGEKIGPTLQHFCRECAKRGIGVTPVVGNGAWVTDPSKRYLAEEWASFLVKTFKDEPNLAMWDVSNEPDVASNNERKQMNFENCRYMSELFHKLDPDTPVTIGCATVRGMKALSEYMDVLQFHNYSDTREGIRNTINEAKMFAKEAGKPIFNGEIGCIGRANPYDVTLQEHMEAGMGWCIWELMIVREGWGKIHGVFYEDGTVRDPSIVAAILGFFRNRDNICLEIPDAEDRVTKSLTKFSEWKADGCKDFDKGIAAAELAANVIESSQLAAMHEAPLYKVNMVRKSRSLTELAGIIDEFTRILEPFKKTKGN